MKQSQGKERAQDFPENLRLTREPVDWLRIASVWPVVPQGGRAC